MQWTVQVTVVLLNIVWIIFFLQPDPPSVFVQRRSSDSSDEEMQFGEFCIRPQSDMKWTPTEHSVNITSNKTNNSNTTAEVHNESNFPLNEVHSMNTTKIQQDCHCNKTNMRKKDLNFSNLLIEVRPPAPGCEPKIIMMFPNKEVCMDEEIFFSAIAPLSSDWDETTPARPPAQKPPSSEVTAASGLISSSSSEAAGVGVTHQSKPPVHEKDNQDRNGPVAHAGACCVRVSSAMIPYESIKGYMIQPRHKCSIRAIIFITDKGQSFCVHYRAPWVLTHLRAFEKNLRSRKSNETSVEADSGTGLA